MRRLLRATLAAVTLAAGLAGVTAFASPAAAEGKCVEVYLYVTNPPTGATVCTPDV